MGDVRAHAAGSLDGAPALRVDGRAARLILVVNEDWMFWSHRLSLARAARAAGADVVVATRVGRHGERIAREGFRLVPLPWQRGARNALVEAKTIARLARLFRDERPDLVHHVGVKAALYGGVAARLSGGPRQVYTLAGFGYVLTSEQWRARALRPLFRAGFRRVLAHPAADLIVQNPDDRDEVERHRLFEPSRVHLIRGSGVDTVAFAPAPEPGGVVTVVLAGRLVRAKGVHDMAHAARLLRERGAKVRVVLVGDPDPENPESVTGEELRAWSSDGLVEWRPWVDDMPSVWRAAHVAALPSYREGLPKTLLEAAACGRPLVASDVPGCREIVRDGENGILVPVRDPRALADAIERLARDAPLRAAMGRRSRELVETFYSDDVIVRETLALYRDALARGRGERGA